MTYSNHGHLEFSEHFGSSQHLIQPSCSAHRVSPQQCGLMAVAEKWLMQLVAGDAVFSEQKS